MPINIPADLPAFNTLVGENIFVMSSDKAMKQDIRPLRVAIFNLMPTKIETETQLLRLLNGHFGHCNVNCVEDVLIDDILYLGKLLGSNRLKVREVETAAFIVNI